MDTEGACAMKTTNVAAIVIIWALGVFLSLAAEKQSPSEIWEKAIKAQGGHAKLQAIDNILVSIRYGKGTNRTVQELLIVPPARMRFWDDTLHTKAPGVVGVSAPADGKACLLQSGESAPTWTLIDNPIPGYGRVAGEVLPFILESKLVRPVVHDMRPGRVGRKQVNILTATANGRTVEFYLDLETNLPLRVFFPDWRHPDITILSYQEVDGIKVPRKAEDNFFGGKPAAFYSLEFNVAYGESIFNCTSHDRLR